jgi:hypothetical protein
MIHIDLSVAPHHRASPPHVILKKQFDKWEDALEWCQSMGFKTDSPIEDILINPSNEYAQVELGVMEATGQNYTEACLSIEGNEERPEPARGNPIPELLYVRGWAEARIENSLGDLSPTSTHQSALIACDLIIDYLKARPAGPGTEMRLVHIYG